LKSVILGNVRYAIIADIHANLEAFTAVLDDISQWGKVAELWCLGDIVGYGPDPHQCIELLRQYDSICVAGNHDRAAIGKLNIAYFNPEAATACQWTAGQLSPDDLQYLESLPLVIHRDRFTLVHGSPREPLLEYLLSTQQAVENLPYFSSPVCLVGHSHKPLVFTFSRTGAGSQREFPAGAMLPLADNRLIINPGGVGQPRDGDPRASYAIYDAEAGSISHYRVPYDIRATQSRMMEHGLPRGLILRLSYGL
jgi:diadenosine tetraphosphatase ApaH/serine/threonine PP2A family protein phosphatase